MLVALSLCLARHTGCCSVCCRITSPYVGLICTCPLLSRFNVGVLEVQEYVCFVQICIHGGWLFLRRCDGHCLYIFAHLRCKEGAEDAFLSTSVDLTATDQSLFWTAHVSLFCICLDVDFEQSSNSRKNIQS